MRERAMKHILIFATSVGLAMPSYATSQCQDIKAEIQNINEMQNDITVKSPFPNGENMDLRTAKKNRDALLAEALAMQALINIKNDYNEVNRKLHGSTIQKVLTKEAMEVFKDVKKNMEKIYTYGLVKNSVKAMALAQVLDQSYEKHAESSKRFNTSYDAPSKDLFTYMETCKRRTWDLAGRSGLKDNLNENVADQAEKNAGDEAGKQRDRIIADFNRNCDQTQKLFKHLKNDPEMMGLMQKQLKNLSGLYTQIGDNSSLKNLATQVAEHDIYLQANADDTEFNKRIDSSYNQIGVDTFNRNFDAYHSLYSEIKREAKTRLDGLAAQVDSKVDSAITAKNLGADMLFSADQGGDEFKAFTNAIKAVEKKCLNVSLEKCTTSNDPSLTKFKQMLSDYATKMDKRLEPSAIFAKGNELSQEKDGLQQKIKQRFADLKQKMDNLLKKHQASGVAGAGDIFTKDAALMETLKNLGCDKFAQNLEADITKINNNSGIGKCLNDNLTKEKINEKLSATRDTIKKYDNVINAAMNSDKKFRDLEKIKYISSLNYTTSCNSNGAAEVTEVSLIGTDDACLKKYFQTDPNNSINASVSGLMKETNNAISEFLADDFIKELGDGKDFIKDRSTWLSLKQEYCSDIELDTECSAEDKMCNSCKFVEKHKQEVYYYNDKIERNKLSKGMYREWDPVRKKMVRKKHPISNIYAHTAKYFAKNLGAFMMPRIGMYQFRTGLIQAEQNAMFMKQQYHWQQQINENMLTNPALFNNFYGTSPSVGMGMPITTSQ
jgi:hypothetical protein